MLGNVAYPQTDEYFHYYGVYVRHVPPGADIFALLAQQPDDLRTLLQSVTDEQAHVRPSPSEWSIKEVVGHLCDAERILAYRLLRIARGDTTPIPGFEQDDFVRGTDFNRRTLPDLIAEFKLQRQSNVLCFQPLTAAEIARSGTASDHHITARASLFILVGHVIHHIKSLKTDYHIG